MQLKPDILVVGAGYVGLATAVFLANKKFNVTVAEKNSITIDLLQQGELPFREPNLSRHLTTAQKANRIGFHTPEKSLYADADVIFIAIDSVNRSTNKMRLHQFEQLAEWIGGVKHRTSPTVVLKSTNAIGFSDQFRKLLNKTPYGEKVRLVVNPEFLREGQAYEDTAKPWRIILGADSKRDLSVLLTIYRSVYDKSIPIIQTDCRSAELIKLASNVYLAHRLAFIHEVADFARIENLDIETIQQGIGLDPRIGTDYFEPGLGFGGSCLPKDCSLINSKEAAGDFIFKSAQSALAINDWILDNLVKKLKENLGSLRGKKIAILGITFKPDIDDTRGSQAVALALKLQKEGAKLGVYDPYLVGMDKTVEGNIPLEQSLQAAIKGASAIIIGAAHSRFKNIKPLTLKTDLKKMILCDYFNIFNHTKWKKAGFTVI